MAIINGLYIHVVDESLERGVEATSHPVEEGVPTSDTVKSKALTIALSGKIVDYGEMKAAQILGQIKAWMAAGSLVTYQGRSIASSLQIRSFQTEHPYTNHGGADFTMTLTEVRIAKSAYVPQKESDTVREETAKQPENLDIKVGNTVVFIGGPVYEASDATKAAATRGRSTCKVTIISTASWSVHQYHLISSDGGKVYGWVDKANISGITSTSTSGTTNAGKQQVQSNGSSAVTSAASAAVSGSLAGAGLASLTKVWHHVRSGETLSGICAQYSHLTPQPTISTVMANNQHAFSTPGVANTLRAGEYLLMGFK